MKKITIAFAIFAASLLIPSCNNNAPKQIAESKQSGCGCGMNCACNEKNPENHCGCNMTK